MKLLKDYFDIQRQIYEYFGFEEVWRVIPLDDATEYFWALTSTGVRFCQVEAGLNNPESYSESEFYQHRHMNTSVFRKDDYTMVAVDTNTDGSLCVAFAVSVFGCRPGQLFLMIFDSAKERELEDLEDELEGE